MIRILTRPELEGGYELRRTLAFHDRHRLSDRYVSSSGVHL